MAKNKPLLAALKRAGMQIDGQDVEMESEDMSTPTEQASTKLAALQAAHDSLLAIDPDAPSLADIKKDIETVKRQTGHTAQSKTVKDLTALDYQLSLNHETVVREQQTNAGGTPNHPAGTKKGGFRPRDHHGKTTCARSRGPGQHQDPERANSSADQTIWPRAYFTTACCTGYCTHHNTTTSNRHDRHATKPTRPSSIHHPTRGLRRTPENPPAGTIYTHLHPPASPGYRPLSTTTWWLWPRTGCTQHDHSRRECPIPGQGDTQTNRGLTDTVTKLVHTYHQSHHHGHHHHHHHHHQHPSYGFGAQAPMAQARWGFWFSGDCGPRPFFHVIFGPRPFGSKPNLCPRPRPLRLC